MFAIRGNRLVKNIHVFFDTPQTRMSETSIFWQAARLPENRRFWHACLRWLEKDVCFSSHLRPACQKWLFSGKRALPENRRFWHAGLRWVEKHTSFSSHLRHACQKCLISGKRVIQPLRLNFFRWRFIIRRKRLGCLAWLSVKVSVIRRTMSYGPWLCSHRPWRQWKHGFRLRHGAKFVWGHFLKKW